MIWNKLRKSDKNTEILMDEGGMIQFTSLMVGFCHWFQSIHPHHHLHCRSSRSNSLHCSQSHLCLTLK